MNPVEASQRFQNASAGSQARILARIAHMLTIAARESYEAGSDAVTDPQALRRSNEVMHRITSQIKALLENDKRKFPDEVILQIIDGIQSCSGEKLLVSAVTADDARNEQGEQS